MRRLAYVVTAVALVALPLVAVAQQPPVNGSGRVPVGAPAPGPASAQVPAVAAATGFAVPRAQCGPGSLPERDLQGEVGQAEAAFTLQGGYRCNLALVSKYVGNGANIQMAWYGTCAYMATIWDPQDPQSKAQQGTVIVDFSDPAHPHQTALLQTPAMISPHESLKVNVPRGLLAADEGAAGVGPSPTDALYPLNNSGPHFEVYDVAHDCKHPRLLSSVSLNNGSGHEGDFAPDGNTYYESTIENAPKPAIIAIDVRDPQHPRELLQWASPIRDAAHGFHGLQVSPDGNTGYFMAQGGAGNGLAIVDLTEVQRRAAHPHITLVSHVAWTDGQVVQIGLPVRIAGRPYVIASEEFGSEAYATQACGEGRPPFGYLHIVDTADLRHPKIVSKVALEVNDPANCAVTMTESVAPTPLTYSSHYCSVDNPRATTVVACTWIGSGLRVFDVRDVLHPREIAYYNPAPVPTALRGAVLKPAVVPNPRQDATASNVRWQRMADGTWRLWYMSTQNGVQILRFTNHAYPRPST